MNFNNIQALATAAIYATNARCNDAQAQALETAINEAFRNDARPTFFLAEDGLVKGREVSVEFKGYTYTISESYTTGKYTVTIKN